MDIEEEGGIEEEGDIEEEEGIEFTMVENIKQEWFLYVVVLIIIFPQ